MANKYVSKASLGKYHAGLIAKVRALIPTKASLGLGNVEDKSSATIRGEITAADVAPAFSGMKVGDLPGWSGD